MFQGVHMFIRMIVEENPNNADEDIQYNAQELLMVKKAIEKLDGKKKTAIILKRDESNYMVVGGGDNNKFAVRAVLKGKQYFMSNKFDVVKPPIEIIVGGKAKMYPSKRCMNLEMVLESAKHFADRGSLAQTFNWELA